MAEYPNNSHNAERLSVTAVLPIKKVEKVVTSSVKSRKKERGTEVCRHLRSGGHQTASRVIFLMDVVVPGIKNAIADVVSIVLFGEAGRIGGKRVLALRYLTRGTTTTDGMTWREYNRPGWLRAMSMMTSSLSPAEMPNWFWINWRKSSAPTAWPAWPISMIWWALLGAAIPTTNTVGRIFAMRK